MDMPADFALKATLPPFSGKGAAMLIFVIPGYQSGQRLASLKSAMVSCGEALIWTLRCTIAIVDLLALSCVVPLRDARVRSSALSPVSLLLRTRTTSAQDLAPAIARRRAWAYSALLRITLSTSPPGRGGRVVDGRSPPQLAASPPRRRSHASSRTVSPRPATCQYRPPGSCRSSSPFGSKPRDRGASSHRRTTRRTHAGQSSAEDKLLQAHRRRPPLPPS